MRDPLNVTRVSSQPMFYAFLSGDGGCDYTMGCNLQLVKMEAKTWEEANIEAGKLADEYREYTERILILNVEETRTFDLKAHKQLRAHQKKKREAAKEEADARKQFESLKKRFESQPD